jgi:hypothetical protein
MDKDRSLEALTKLTKFVNNERVVRMVTDCEGLKLIGRFKVVILDTP